MIRSLRSWAPAFLHSSPPILSTLSLRSRSFSTSPALAMKHHLMVGTWVAPGRIYTVQFDDEALTLELVKKTDIPEDEPISWMAFDVSANL